MLFKLVFRYFRRNAAEDAGKLFEYKMLSATENYVEKWLKIVDLNAQVE
jgi:hypothetical protein